MVSELWEGLNKSRMAWIVSQRAADVADTLDESVVGDRNPVPDVFDEFLFSNQPLAPLQQIKQHLKRLLTEVMLLSIPLY